MINCDVPNADFIDCGLWYHIALLPHLEQVFRLKAAHDDMALKW